MAHVLGDDLARCCDHFTAGSPFGEDAREDQSYLDLRAEIEKLTALSSTQGEIDWKGIKTSSLEILAAKSKDLSVAGYLALALFQLHGFGGLADGIEILHKYLAEDWDGVFPQRPKAKISAIQWLFLRLPPYIETRPPNPADASVLATLQEQLKTFQRNVYERMPDTVSFQELNEALAPHLEAAPAVAPPREETVQSQPAPAAETVAAAPQPPPPPPVEAGPPAAADEIVDRIRQLVPALRQADAFSPVPYRLLRSLKWDTVAAPPVVDPNAANPGTTRVPAPRGQQQTALEGLFEAASWNELLRASEAAFQEATGTYWLDLQRYTVAALEGLDPKAGARAAEAIKDDLARLLKRFPTLATLYFVERPTARKSSQGVIEKERVPFASDATRQWLDTLAVAAEPAAAPMFLPPPTRTVEGSSEPALSPADARAVQEMLTKQQLGAAFEILQGAVERAGTLRARFRTRLAAARVCLQANQAAWARSLLEELLRESEAFGFEDWEPETAADLYQLLALCYARPAKKGGPADPEAARVQLETLRRKLFRLDMRAAAVLEEALRR
jgi:type VI secretion system protein VasJ